MKSQDRQLRTSWAQLAKRHIRLSGLKPRDMVRWANLNLIDWLNKANEAQSASVQRVIEIIGLARQASRIIEEVRQASTSEERRLCSVRLHPVMLKLNAALLRYECKAVVYLYGSALWGQYLFSARTRDRRETVAVAFLFENLALVHRIRRCLECRRWFFAITEHQKYCGDGCRKRHAARGEEFLEKRRSYMREYRRREKARDLHVKRLAGVK
jgi:hypothetical protein